jgi:glycerophosphoryl diester phosphodiesterase
VPTVELDLLVTRDRVLAVYHDPALDPERCRHDEGRPLPKALLRDLDFADLARIHCGLMRPRRFPQQQLVARARIPRLEQVFALAREAPYAVRLNLEMKMREPEKTVPAEEFARLVVAAVRSSGLTDRITVQSFHAPALREVRRMAPDLPLAMLVVKRKDYDRLMEESGADILSPYYPRLERADVARFRGRGKRVVPWTVNARRHIRRLLAWGVDGIISDYPDRVIAIRKERAAAADPRTSAGRR